MCKLYSPCLKDAVYEIPLHLEYWFTRRRVLHVFPYISLCKMKPNFTPFCPLLGPNRCQALDFRKFKSPFPKDTFYQIWFKSVQWFWRRSRLKEKFTDGRQTVADTYSSLWAFGSGELKSSISVIQNIKIWSIECLTKGGKLCVLTHTCNGR